MAYWPVLLGALSLPATAFAGPLTGADVASGAGLSSDVHQLSVTVGGSEIQIVGQQATAEVARVGVAVDWLLPDARGLRVDLAVQGTPNALGVTVGGRWERRPHERNLRLGARAAGSFGIGDTYRDGIGRALPTFVGGTLRVSAAYATSWVQRRRATLAQVSVGGGAIVLTGGRLRLTFDTVVRGDFALTTAWAGFIALYVRSSSDNRDLSIGSQVGITYAFGHRGGEELGTSGGSHAGDDRSLETNQVTAPCDPLVLRPTDWRPP